MRRPWIAEKPSSPNSECPGRRLYSIFLGFRGRRAIAALVSAIPVLLLATRNPHKVEEIAAILAGLVEVRDLSFLPEAPPVEETGTTFAENARLKALEISALTDVLVLADDSGLVVDALGGAPGVHSARYAGPEAQDAENNRKLVEELAAVPASARGARFRCAMVVAQKGKVVAEFEGSLEGSILPAARGQEGFGYDPLFVPAGETLTLAELGAAKKNTLSHRARALEEFRAWADQAL